MKNSYAVVDLETTNANWHDNGRIIQFGCALIENGEITKIFNQKVNPEVPIPSRITALTGLSDEDVKDAPTFKEIAPDIFKLLKDKIFIAHNVNFDLPFLNRELNRVGLNELNVKAIDTVELAQIMFPTVSSYKLQDLTSYLSIEHDNPHSADSDALVTAKLFLIIESQIRDLPMTTLKSLVNLGTQTIRETNLVFKNIYEQRSGSQKLLPDYLYEKNGLVLRKKNFHISDQIDKRSSYPNTENKKRAALKGKLDYRQNQADLMDHIYKTANLRQKNKKWNLIEAPTGSGKTLGYLLPLSYMINSGQKLIIATTTKVLQQQIIEQSIPLLNQVTNNSYHAEIVRSSYNFIDLDRFYESIENYQGHRHTALLKMKIMVWLTITTTGNLDELHLTNYNNPLFTIIRHRGEVKENTIFAKDDFWYYQQNRCQESLILVTNQAYLARHLDSTLWGDNSYLVIDEANHFADNLRNVASPTVDFFRLNEYVKKLSDILYQNRVTLRYAFTEVTTQLWNYQDLQDMETHFEAIDELMQRLEFNLFENNVENFVGFEDRSSFVHLLLQQADFQKDNPDLINLLSDLIVELSMVVNRIDVLFDQYNFQRNFISVELSRVISNLIIENAKIRTTLESMDELLQVIQEPDAAFGIEIDMRDYYEPNTLKLSWRQYDITDLITETTDSFSQIFAIGAAITIQKDFSHFILDLQLDEEQINEMLILPDSNDMAHNSKIYIPKDVPDVTKLSNDDYYSMVTKHIVEILDNMDHQTMILFNSLSTLEAVYNKLMETDVKEKWEILAQGVTGTNEKIKKRFAIGNRSVLLGANSFWEGVDFPNKLLEILIVTRIPFESPEMLDVKVRQEVMAKNGFNVFQADTLPRAILQLRQGLGRLVRTPHDRGVILLLDNRILTKNYGKTIVNSLPSGLPIVEDNMRSIKKDINKFLK
ncbi:helicase C-terminal domain-containing protein [Companilactobacillus sp.]|uniref:helicase C-terminal domain-containing protein n=1 Tax=Companilactobacillus sp. TaxID=2767905 RepID=UPI0025BD46A7|nr:helicase C-terminal domain-containing protein [Companilactobacillus sp.]MCH4008243.1 DEAD/DEAH box helicase [Companilactobacillus sp.]MCH4051578.1 DEAD/DEAH box helicase [Companilactobacillus sp.]MCH4076186.1 DEAD/DEAH box helicase [Companilactobacillus sp.]MCH4124761.1 DEAD/DEAH box helicase [Companilactobacillus sp.]MCH4131303.1 DEAD/DEAH box helicase [Companilactobacillus sp.]